MVSFSFFSLSSFDRMEFPEDFFEILTCVQIEIDLHVFKVEELIKNVLLLEEKVYRFFFLLLLRSLSPR